MPTTSSKVIKVYEKRTSIRVFSSELKIIDFICKREGLNRRILFELIALNKDENIGLTAAIRLFCLLYHQIYIKDKNLNIHHDKFHNYVFEAIKNIV